MIPAVDSISPPTDAQIAEARAAGIRQWNGYIPGPRVLSGSPGYPAWNAERCAAVATLGARPVLYCSGFSDPGYCRDLAAQWGARPCLDVESSIRPDGPWVQAWLDASDAGLYGNAPVHNGRHAAFHVLAAYPGHDPQAVWAAAYARPAGPVGWQWQGSASMFGMSVDRSWMDDWFLDQGAPVVAHHSPLLLLS